MTSVARTSDAFAVRIMSTSPTIEVCPSSWLPFGARLGDVVSGKYQLERIVGRGGMGVVVSALDMRLPQRVAIKFMSPLRADDKDYVRRFILEARAAALLRCEHVARVFDVGSLPDSTPYIVMEYLDGEDLQSLLDRRGCVPLPEAVDYVLQAGEAIAEAHCAGIVHRDLKPSNLFRSRHADGSALIKVLDFGLSKVVAAALLSDGTPTAPNAVVGSPLYCSPEQLSAPASVDSRTDIWALGTILCELSAGKAPFAANTIAQVCANIVDGTFQPLRVLRPELPAAFGAVIARSLARDPGKRFQTVAHLAKALAPFAPRHSLQSVQRIENILHRGTNTVFAGTLLAKRHPNSARVSAWPVKVRGGSGERTLRFALVCIACIALLALLIAWVIHV